MGLLLGREVGWVGLGRVRGFLSVRFVHLLRSAFCVVRFAFCVVRCALCVVRFAFCAC